MIIMETIIRKYSYLSDEQLGQIVKLSLKYIDNEEITDNDATKEMRQCFNMFVRKDLDKMLKDRSRMRQKRGVKNES